MVCGLQHYRFRKAAGTREHERAFAILKMKDILVHSKHDGRCLNKYKQAGVIDAATQINSTNA